MNQVKSVIWLTWSKEPARFIEPARTKAITPKPMNNSGGLPSSLDQLPSKVRQVLSAAVNIVRMVRTVATVLSAGIQAGTGALLEMPPQLPNRISIQKAKSAR